MYVYVHCIVYCDIHTLVFHIIFLEVYFNYRKNLFHVYNFLSISILSYVSKLSFLQIERKNQIFHLKNDGILC